MPGYNTEADYENAIIELFRNDLGYEYVYGPDVERDFKSPLYDSVLEESLYRLNKAYLLTPLTTLYSNCATLKMASLYRRTPNLWSTCKAAFRSAT